MRAAGVVYFTGTQAGPTERHLYAVSLAGGRPAPDHDRARRAPGQAGPRPAAALSTWSIRSPSRPRVTLRSLDDGAELAVIYEADDPRMQELALPPPELVTLDNRSGVSLHGLLYRPDAARFGPGPVPDHRRRLRRAARAAGCQLLATARANMRAQYLRSLGFLVFMLDNRGSAGRGLAVRGARSAGTWATPRCTTRWTGCAGSSRRAWPTATGWACMAGATAATWR